jgi:flagellar motor protein MotB
MRSIIFFALLLVVTSCISPKRLEEASARFEKVLNSRDSVMTLQSDSILTLALALERSRGGNDMLLLAQDKLQAKIMEQDDALEALQGNLNSTSSQMRRQLAGLREDLDQSEAKYQQLLEDQRALIEDFQETGLRAGRVITDSLDGRIPDASFYFTERAGEFIMSVQEDLLFAPRSVDRLTPAAEYVMRAVMGALDADPLLKLMVVGHTDNQPSPRRNTNNWEYAALRATHIAEELAQTYYLSPNRVIASSHGEYGPTSSNATEDGRKRNRRIDFVFRNSISTLIREMERLGKEK